MDKERVLFLEASSRDEVLKQMVDCAALTGGVADKNEFYQAILHREKVVSTGIGMGVALPHAKLASCPHFFIVIGILKKAVEWGALDHMPVRLVFLIGGPDDQQTEYLQLLYHLTHAIKSEERKKQLLFLKEGEAIVELFHKI